MCYLFLQGIVQDTVLQLMYSVLSEYHVRPCAQVYILYLHSIVQGTAPSFTLVGFFQGIVQGTVPYLGTFLTDLTMIDTAIPDRTECGLINFEKRRKEFEVLAQIKLLQSAAQIYHFQEDKHIWAWFDSVRVFDENEW